MKRLLSFITVFVVILFLIACQSGQEPETLIAAAGETVVPSWTPDIPETPAFAASTESPVSPAFSAAPTDVSEETLVLITPTPEPTPVPTEEPTPTPAPTPTPTPSPTPTPEPTPEPPGLIGWSQGGFVPREEQRFEENEYAGETLHVTVTKVVDNELVGRKLTYYVTDIYLRDIRCLRTESAKGFGSGARADVAVMAKRVNAIAAISGDMFNQHKHQLVIRNGEVFDTKSYSNWDVCLLYQDGTMETMTAESFKSFGARSEVWQAWNFGPSLLDSEGHALTKFPTSDVNPQNPRSVIGYYEPGHYCFVTVDGRQKHSRGLTLQELAQLMESLGCRIAYNLDGGESASLYWNGGIYSKPSGDGRDMSDIVYLIDIDDPVSLVPAS